MAGGLTYIYQERQSSRPWALSYERFNVHAGHCNMIVTIYSDDVPNATHHRTYDYEGVNTALSISDAIEEWMLDNRVAFNHYDYRQIRDHFHGRK